MKQPPAKLRLWIPLLAALIAFSVIAYIYDPTGGGFPYPRCLFKQLTGWDCPGCGFLRAFHALLHGDIAAAWAFNPALPFLLIAAIAALLIDSCGSPRLRLAMSHPLTLIATLAAILLWTVFRNLSS